MLSYENILFSSGIQNYHKQEQRITVKLDNTKLFRKAIPSSFHKKSLTWPEDFSSNRRQKDKVSNIFMFCFSYLYFDEIDYGILAKNGSCSFFMTIFLINLNYNPAIKLSFIHHIVNKTYYVQLIQCSYWANIEYFLTCMTKVVKLTSKLRTPWCKSEAKLCAHSLFHLHSSIYIVPAVFQKYLRLSLKDRYLLCYIFIYVTFMLQTVSSDFHLYGMLTVLIVHLSINSKRF